jgi:uncharacterized protein (TIGR02646 family)
MKRIVKSAAPAPLSVAKQRGWNWDEFTQQDHQGYLQCRQQASAEQGLLCAYTELPLYGKGITVHLDHYKKKSIYPNLTFEWNNIVCAVRDSRFGANHKDRMVNGANAETVYTSILNPMKDDAQSYFYYDIEGVMHPKLGLNAEQQALAQESIRYFNLNETMLVSRRRALILQLQDCSDLPDSEIRGAFADYGFTSVLEQELLLIRGKRSF